MATTIGGRYLKAQTSEVLRRVEDGEVDDTASLKGRFHEWPDLTWDDFMDAKRIWESKPLPND